MRNVLPQPTDNHNQLLLANLPQRTSNHNQLYLTRLQSTQLSKANATTTSTLACVVSRGSTIITHNGFVGDRAKEVEHLQKLQSAITGDSTNMSQAE